MNRLKPITTDDCDKMLTAERLREVLSYDETTGVFTWMHRPNSKRWNTKNAGKVAGSVHNGGYLHLSLDNQKYLNHRMAWLYVYGEWPRRFVDHINLDKTDNRISNLRLADFAENSANISTRKNSVSGFRGVSFLTSRQRWIAQIHKNKRYYRLGSFKDKECAARAYAEAAQNLYGEFCPLHLREKA